MRRQLVQLAESRRDATGVHRGCAGDGRGSNSIHDPGPKDADVHPDRQDSDSDAAASAFAYPSAGVESFVGDDCDRARVHRDCGCGRCGAGGIMHGHRHLPIGTKHGSGACAEASGCERAGVVDVARSHANRIRRHADLHHVRRHHSYDQLQGHVGAPDRGLTLRFTRVPRSNARSHSDAREWWQSASDQLQVSGTASSIRAACIC